MDDEEQAQRDDLAFRRDQIRRAVELIWQVDAGERQPAMRFTLDGEGEPTGAAVVPATGARSEGEPPGPRSRQVLPAKPVHTASHLAGQPAAELGRLYRSGELSPVEVAREALRRAEEEQPRLNAFIRLLPEQALAEAEAAERRFRRKEDLGPLDGVPVAVKDIIDMAGVPTTAASRVLAGFVPAKDAPVVERLRAGGAVLIGKTNLHEFAYGGSGDVSAFGPSRNPRATDRITGGSSGGSGAAVAAGICPIALGTDTGGSVRIPAALCGVVGLKPTYGRVSTTGVIPLSWSLDHVGPLAATAEDAALALSVMSAFDLNAWGLQPWGGGSAKRPRVGLCRELFFEHLDMEVRRLLETALAALGEPREVRLPHIHVTAAAQSVVISAEAGAYHRRWLEQRGQDYDWRIRNRLRASEEVGGPDYVQAVRLRTLAVSEMRALFDEVDVLAMPTSPIPAPPLLATEASLEDGKGHPAALLLRNTAPMNFTGFPAISLPCGQTSQGLPVGLQLVCPPWQEARLLDLAWTFERHRWEIDPRI